MMCARRRTPRSKNPRAWIVAGCLFAFSTCLADVRAAEADVPQKRALLIGCGVYPNLPESLLLRGPVNDVRLMRDLLTTRLGFLSDYVVSLADDSPATNLPTYANIQREFDHLAAAASADDEILIYYSGHGTQQPDDDDSDDDFEPDGLDEVLCTRDVAKLTAQGGKSIPGGLVDDVLKVWLDAILARGARVWVIIDACHSGTAVRGDETIRGIPADELLPGAAKAVPRRSRGAMQQSSLDRSAMTMPPERLVVLYAAQSNEPTVEKRLPRSGSERRPHGLMTYTLVETLSRGPQGLAYRDIAAQIVRRYSEDGRSSPTPWIEGPAADEVIFGAAPVDERRHLQLTNRLGRLMVTGGSIDGLSVGTIVAVSATPDDVENPLGYARITEAGPWESSVEACAHASRAAVDSLPPHGYCRVVESGVSTAVLRLSLPADLTEIGEASPASRSWPAGVELASSRQDADWILSCVEGQWLLTSNSPSPSSHGIAATDSSTPEFTTQLDQVLSRQLRTQRLLGLANSSEKDTSTVFGAAKAELRPLIFSDTRDRVGRALDLSQQPLVDGTIIAFEIVNTGNVAVDVSLLFVAADGGLQPLFPAAGREGDARLPPGRSLRTPRAVVEAVAHGVEHLLMIAAAADGAPQLFTWVAEEPKTWSAKSASATRGESTSENQIQECLLGRAGTRGSAAASLVIKKLTWRVSPTK